jgi:GH25 family lysozyme M1 (1,4-beta-N-acetylmuramidase)
MTITGIDVSAYQPVKFNTRGAEFVFIKATEGRGWKSDKQSGQTRHAREHGLVVGFYHFLRPGDMAQQARHFVETAASIEGDPLFADWEDSRVSCAKKDQFLAEVERLRGATHRIGLYCNVDFWLHRDTTSNAGEALWIAHYNGRPGHPGIRANWRFHQFKEHPVDTNVGAFPDKKAMQEWTRKMPVPA